MPCQYIHRCINPMHACVNTGASTPCMYCMYAAVSTSTTHVYCCYSQWASLIGAFFYLSNSIPLLYRALHHLFIYRIVSIADGSSRPGLLLLLLLLLLLFRCCLLLFRCCLLCAPLRLLLAFLCVAVFFCACCCSCAGPRCIPAANTGAYLRSSTLELGSLQITRKNDAQITVKNNLKKNKIGEKHTHTHKQINCILCNLLYP